MTTYKIKDRIVVNGPKYSWIPNLGISSIVYNNNNDDDNNYYYYYYYYYYYCYYY